VSQLPESGNIAKAASSNIQVFQSVSAGAGQQAGATRAESRHFAVYATYRSLVESSSSGSNGTDGNDAGSADKDRKTVSRSGDGASAMPVCPDPLHVD
jgi:hypothetical protein